MIGHLPSPIGTNDGNCSGLSHMGTSSGLPERKYRVVLEQPELVGRITAPVIHVHAHRLHRLAVRYASEPPDSELTPR